MSHRNAAVDRPGKEQREEGQLEIIDLLKSGKSLEEIIKEYGTGNRK